MIGRKHRNSIGAVMAEFGPALFIFFFIVLFPLINLIAMATGASTVYLVAKQCALKAGQSGTFGDALLGAEAVAWDIESGGFGKFANLVPVGGFNGSGMDLYVTEININTDVITRNGPNVPTVSSPVNPDDFLYSYDAVVTYDIGPFMNLSSVPFIGNVPGVGVPARLTYTASSNIEHTEGLQVGVSPGFGPPPRDHGRNGMDR